MPHLPALAALVLASLGLCACKIVPNDPGGATAAETAGEGGDAARIDALLAQTLAPQLLPLVKSSALGTAELRGALAGGLDSAGAAHGHRGAGDGAAWNFAVTGQGTVVAANLQSRARKAELDTDGDGAADLVLQLGPVIKGTALRDLAPFYDFNDFRDQIEFAKLGRAINDAVSARLTLPDVAPGQVLVFTGALALAKATDPWLITVTELGVAP